MNEERALVHPSLIRNKVYELVKKASVSLHPRYYEELRKRAEEETSENARWILQQLLENTQIAQQENLPLCQDTGYVIVFFTVGRDVCLPADVQVYVDEAVRTVYNESLLRASIVSHPFSRVNTRDNTPAVVHIEQGSGSGLEIDVMLKGAGSENASALKMLSPAEGEDGVRRFVLQTLRSTAWNACPPLIIGLGIGGTMETSAYLAKKAILNWVKGKEMGIWERDLMMDINNLGIGPGGVGGKLTCLGVSLETAPCHIATLPVALCVQCYATRIASDTLSRQEIESIDQGR
ncbi:fumarate hydratase [bacterium]|nr:fumarate hydratase [bacterium]